MSERCTPAEMGGDFLREAAVLIAVFGPVDALFNRALTLWVFVLTLILAAVLMVVGVFVEVTRK